MKPLFLSISLFLALAISAAASTYHISSEEQFNSISPKLIAGDEVIIKNGTYTSWSVEISSKGTAKAPIIVRAETEGKVIFSGEVNRVIFKLTGSYLVLKGIAFNECTLLKSASIVVIDNANNCSLRDCTFNSNTVKAQYTPLVVISGTGNANEVSNCSFSSNIDNQDVQVKITKETSPLFTLIEHNHFENKNKVSWKNGNGGECVQIGQDPVLLGTVLSKSTVRFNRFIRCNGEGEVISNKSSGNTYAKNYFENNNGELVMRGGHDCVIDANIIKGGSGGIRVNGTGHTITNNQISGVKTAIRLMYGMAKGKTDIGFYIAASNCILKNNLIEEAEVGILVGDSKDADWTGKFDTVRYPSPVVQNIAPFNNKMEGNVFTKTKKNQVVQ